MKLIRRRDYKTSDRLGFEGIYLEKSGFTCDKSINYSINRKSKSLMIKIAKTTKGALNKVTHNITRSGKKVPAICIKNKEIKSFIEENGNLEIIIFNGIIIIASKDSNKNIVISKALIDHNKSLKENARKVFESLVSINLIDDSFLINEIEELNNKSKSIFSEILKVPRKVFNKIKKSVRQIICKNYKNKRSLQIASSNSLILASIIEDKKDLNELEEETIIEASLEDSWYYLNKCVDTYNSYINQKGYLYGCKKNNYTNLNNDLNLIYFLLNSIDFLEKVVLNLSYKKKVKHFKIQIKIFLIQLGLKFLSFRKQINTLSPPKYTSNFA